MQILNEYSMILYDKEFSVTNSTEIVSHLCDWFIDK